MLSHFFEALSLPSKPNTALKTLSNWSKPLIWPVCLSLPTECSTALPQQRLGGCCGLWAQGVGAWLASARGAKKNHGLKNQKVHTRSIPRRAKTALNSLNLRASVRKIKVFLTEAVNHSAAGKQSNYHTCIIFVTQKPTQHSNTLYQQESSKLAEQRKITASGPCLRLSPITALHQNRPVST